MKIIIATEAYSPIEPVRPGNVYSIRGGRGLKLGHMQVILAITDPPYSHQSPAVLMLVIDKEGNPVGVNSYGLHYIEELQPIAFVEGLEELSFVMRSL